MKAILYLRNAYRRLAARETGLPPSQVRLTSSQQQMAGQESLAARLPVWPADYEITDDDGTPFFMVDFDPVDGGNPIA